MVASDLVRVGLVGAGGVGARHARVLSGLPGVSVVGVADPDAVRAEALAQRCGAAAFADAATLARSVRPDALYVCVPPFAHGEPEAVAVEHGLPLFVEKPLATDLATTERIAEWFHAGLRERLPRAHLVEVTVWEGPDCSATYSYSG